MKSKKNKELEGLVKKSVEEFEAGNVAKGEEYTNHAFTLIMTDAVHRMRFIARSHVKKKIDDNRVEEAGLDETRRLNFKIAFDTVVKSGLSFAEKSYLVAALVSGGIKVERFNAWNEGRTVEHQGRIKKDIKVRFTEITAKDNKEYSESRKIKLAKALNKTGLLDGGACDNWFKSLNDGVYPHVLKIMLGKSDVYAPKSIFNRIIADSKQEKEQQNIHYADVLEFAFLNKTSKTSHESLCYIVSALIGAMAHNSLVVSLKLSREITYWHDGLSDGYQKDFYNNATCPYVGQLFENSADIENGMSRVSSYRKSLWNSWESFASSRDTSFRAKTSPPPRAESRSVTPGSCSYGARIGEFHGHGRSESISSFFSAPSVAVGDDTRADSYSPILSAQMRAGGVYFGGGAPSPGCDDMQHGLTRHSRGSRPQSRLGGARSPAKTAGSYVNFHRRSESEPGASRKR